MDWLFEILKQVPALVVLVWLVNRFLSHLSDRDRTLQDITAVIAAVKEAIVKCEKPERREEEAVR